MKYSDYKKQLEQNPDFREARDELELAFAFADAVLDARLQKGWTQTELAQLVGTRQANISRIEAGLANPTLGLIQKICKALELKFGFLEKAETVTNQPTVIVWISPDVQIPGTRQYYTPFSKAKISTTTRSAVMQ